MAEFTNYYDVLGLNEHATYEQIRNSYRRLMLENHPDRNGNSPNSAERTIILHSAYKTLSDENMRQLYDKSLRTHKISGLVIVQDRYDTPVSRPQRVAHHVGPKTSLHSNRSHGHFSKTPVVIWLTAALISVFVFGGAYSIIKTVSFNTESGEPSHIKQTDYDDSLLYDDQPMNKVFSNYGLSPDASSEAISTRAQALLDSQQTLSAADLLAAAVKLHPHDADLHAMLANAYIDLGMYNGGLTELTCALSLQPKNPDRYISLGSELLSEGKAAPAAKVFQDAIRLRPDDTNALVSYGDALRETRNTDEATKAYTQALAMDPGCIGAHVALQEMRNAAKQTVSPLASKQSSSPVTVLNRANNSP